MVRKQVRIELWAELRTNPLAHQFVRPRGIERLDHVGCDRKRIDFLPGSRLIAQEPELDGQAMVVGGNEGIHPASVRAEQIPRVSIELLNGPRHGLAESERPIFDVESQGALPKNLRELSFREPTANVHLPKAGLGGTETLGQKQILPGSSPHL